MNFTNVTVSDCLQFAYGLVSGDQIAGPEDAPHEQVVVVTQSLPAERLALLVHHEQKELRYPALADGKNGPKMRLADAPQPRNKSTGTGVTTEDAGLGVLLFTAIREQFGLKLESRKGPLDVVVVDDADKVPVEN